MRSPIHDLLPELDRALATALPLFVDDKRDIARDRLIEQLASLASAQKFSPDYSCELQLMLVLQEFRKLKRIVRKFNARYGNHA